MSQYGVLEGLSSKVLPPIGGCSRCYFGDEVSGIRETSTWPRSAREQHCNIDRRLYLTTMLHNQISSLPVRSSEYLINFNNQGPDRRLDSNEDGMIQSDCLVDRIELPVRSEQICGPRSSSWPLVLSRHVSLC